MVIFWLYRHERRLSDRSRRSPGLVAISPWTRGHESDRANCSTFPEGAGSKELCVTDAMLSTPSPCPMRGLGRGEKVRHAGALGAIVAMAAAIAGCAAGAGPVPTVRPLMVQVPVLHETPCPVPVLTHPALPIAGLKPGSSPADTMRAYAAAVTILKGAVRERDAVLAGCAATNHPTQAQAENTQ
jgi:hypothetical protein